MPSGLIRFEADLSKGNSGPAAVSPGYNHGMELLRESIAARRAACERDRLVVRERLAAALAEFLPRGSRGWVYGSLVEPGRFREWSDVDLALEGDPPGMSIDLLASLLAERCGRSIDICLIDETRLAAAIRTELGG